MLINLKKICKKGGLIIFAVPNQWPFHSFPGDYWRYDKNDIQNIFADCQIQQLDEVNNYKHQGYSL